MPLSPAAPAAQPRKPARLQSSPSESSRAGSIKARILVLSFADLAIDLLLPTIVYVLLAPLSLPTTVRLSAGGCLLAAKATSGRIHPGVSEHRPSRGRELTAALAGIFSFGVMIGLSQLGMSAGVAIGAGTAITLTAASVLTVRDHRSFDSFAGLVLCEIGLSVVLTAVSHDARFILARPAFYTAAAGIYVLATIRAARPFMSEVSKPMAVAGDPRRAIAFERAMSESRPFRRAGQAMTLGLGAVLITEAVLRVLVVYSSHNVTTGALVSQVPGIALLIIYFAAIRAFAVPVASREVDALMPPDTHHDQSQEDR
jgi:hypothetical protein